MYISLSLYIYITCIHTLTTNAMPGQANANADTNANVAATDILTPHPFHTRHAHAMGPYRATFMPRHNHAMPD